MRRQDLPLEWRKGWGLLVPVGITWSTSDSTAAVLVGVAIPVEKELLLGPLGGCSGGELAVGEKSLVGFGGGSVAGAVGSGVLDGIPLLVVTLVGERGEVLVVLGSPSLLPGGSVGDELGGMLQEGPVKPS